jgi:8-oxo-dGTP pyrophosphatase MutT (NUDIX family)
VGLGNVATCKDRYVVAREAVRALFVDTSGAVLLMRVVEPNARQAVWITPGGGVIDGEDLATAIRREVFEELGVTIAEEPVPQPGLAREHSFSWAGKRIDQREAFFLIRCERFSPPRCVDGEPGATFECEYQWWTAGEIDASAELFAPEHLATTLREIEAPTSTSRAVVQ